VGVGIERGQDEDLGRRGAASQRVGGGSPVHPEHPNVHQHDVRMVLPDQLKGLGSVPCLGNRSEVGSPAEHHGELEPQDGIIVDHENGHLGDGSHAPTRHPPGAVGP
jgi:hypothetical protein